MLSTICVALSLGGAAAFVPQVRPTAPRIGRAHGVQMESRWTDPILDESKPDPVFDGDSPYKGRVPYGFSNQAELINGRAAMMGFSVLYLQELFVGKGVLEQYGLPYDEGAILLGQAGSGLPGVVGLVLSVAVVTGLTYGSNILGQKFLKP